jgi:hypothetical protein
VISDALVYSFLPRPWLSSSPPIRTFSSIPHRLTLHSSIKSKFWFCRNSDRDLITRLSLGPQLTSPGKSLKDQNKRAKPLKRGYRNATVGSYQTIRFIRYNVAFRPRRVILYLLEETERQTAAGPRDQFWLAAYTATYLLAALCPKPSAFAVTRSDRFMSPQAFNNATR